jgi:hypothetical protein
VEDPRAEEAFLNGPLSFRSVAPTRLVELDDHATVPSTNAHPAGAQPDRGVGVTTEPSSVTARARHTVRRKADLTDDTAGPTTRRISVRSPEQ